VVGKGFGRTYGRAREFGKVALLLDTTAGYHRWRRWVKYSYYQYAWFRETFPEVAAGRERRLKRLGSTLGRVHDVHQLLTELDERSVGISSPRAFRRARTHLRSLETSLKDEAKKLTPKALGRKPARIGRQIVEAVGASELPAVTPQLEFVSLAHHEGDGLVSSARAADAD
jgi:hypothetical protein